MLGHLGEGAWLMAGLLYGSVLRLMECVRLRGKDVDLARHQVMCSRPATGLVDSRSGRGQRHHIAETALQKAVKRAVREARGGEARGCHTFRHSCATHVIESGYDIRTVRELPRHASVETTQIYTHVMNKGGRGVRNPLDNE